ncbi:uncharacterized protein GGS25DRAFT_120153 [Hypoxylon fragiforme]|uniref:uncharacterized protein n=1 Tax=Hypoxylon fragiforme TaxID=63214 RepID=UPI0020C6F5AC|nr:uncharacterized protein GGS25DRAFT_120153 [Hypoxylon fragiforme]KAI2612464.1 hypothetical protein GGS25DRAFT_120153 [Hypoxylon fragiforme]
MHVHTYLHIHIFSYLHYMPTCTCLHISNLAAGFRSITSIFLTYLTASTLASLPPPPSKVPNARCAYLQHYLQHPTRSYTCVGSCNLFGLSGGLFLFLKILFFVFYTNLGSYLTTFYMPSSVPTCLPYICIVYIPTSRLTLVHRPPLT